MSAADIASRPELVHRGAVNLFIGGNIGRAALVRVERQSLAKFADDASSEHAAKTDGDKHQIGLDQELAAGDRLTLLVDFAAFNADQHAVFADQLKRSHLEFAHRTLSL